MTLLTQEAVVALVGAIHLCNRMQGSAVSREILAEFLDAAPESSTLPRTTSLPAPLAAPPEEDTALLKVLSVSSQPVYRGRWADLESDDSDA
jgi:hypothetical protein